METTKIKIPLLSETTDCAISCTHAKSWPPPQMLMAVRFPGRSLDDVDAQWSSGNLDPMEYQRIKVWQSRCGQLKMGHPCFSCDLAKLEEAPGHKLKGPVPLKPLLQKANLKAGLAYNHPLGFLAGGPPAEEEPEASEVSPSEPEADGEGAPKMKVINPAELLKAPAKATKKKRSKKKVAKNSVKPEAPKEVDAPEEVDAPKEVDPLDEILGGLE